MQIDTLHSNEDQLLKGAFSDVYQKALQEELPEAESLIKNNMDYKLSMRQVHIVHKKKCKLYDN